MRGTGLTRDEYAELKFFAEAITEMEEELANTGIAGIKASPEGGPFLSFVQVSGSPSSCSHSA